MAYCQGCGNYVGDYSFYRHKLPGKGDIILCFRCKRWADRHPGRSTFPQMTASLPETRRIRTFSTIYVISSFAMFAVGAVIIISGNHVGIGIAILLGAVSLFLVGRRMKKFSKARSIKNDREK
jgi:hypothetical protein